MISVGQLIQLDPNYTLEQMAQSLKQPRPDQNVRYIARGFGFT